VEDTTPFSSFFVISSDPDYILSGVLLDFQLFLWLCEDVIAEPSFALLDILLAFGRLLLPWNIFVAEGRTASVVVMVRCFCFLGR
jgi:hypothetical protein